MPERNYWTYFSLCVCLWLGSLFPALGHDLQFQATNGYLYAKPATVNLNFHGRTGPVRVYLYATESGFTFGSYFKDLGNIGTDTFVFSQDDSSSNLTACVADSVTPFDQSRPYSWKLTALVQVGGVTVDNQSIVISGNFTVTNDVSNSRRNIAVGTYTFNLKGSSSAELPDGVNPTDDGSTPPSSGEDPVNFVAIGLNVPEQTAVEGEPLFVTMLHQPQGTALEDALEYQFPYEDIFGKTNPLLTLQPGTPLSEGDTLYFPDNVPGVPDAVKPGILKQDATQGWIWIPEGTEVLSTRSEAYVPVEGDDFQLNANGEAVNSDGVKAKDSTVILTKTVNGNGVTVVSTTTVNNNTSTALSNNFFTKLTSEDGIDAATASGLGAGIRYKGDAAANGSGGSEALRNAKEFAPTEPEELFTDYGGDLNTLFEKMEFFAQGTTIPQLSAFHATLPMPWGPVDLNVDLSWSAITVFRTLLEFILTIYSWHKVYKIMSY